MAISSMCGPGGENFFLLNFDSGNGDVINAAAWTAFAGTAESIAFGQIVQDIDNADGGLAVDVGPTDNIDAGESIALFANFDGSSVSAFSLDSVVLGNHPGADFDSSDDLEIWWTSGNPLADLWDVTTLSFDEVNGFVSGLGAITGISFEALEGESTFYLSAAAGDVDSGVIPEPTTALLLGLGVIGLAMRRREV